MSRPVRLFTDFVAAAGVRLTPGQRTICRIAYDGAAIADLTPAERAHAEQIFGPIASIPPEARNVIVAVCGARAGKSYVLGSLRLLHLALVLPLDSLAPGEIASALIVAPDLRLARQCLRYALGAARTVPAIARRISSETSDSFTLARESGRSVIVECLPATRGGSALRGRSLVGAVLDEAAFFRDAEYVVNDEEVFRAVAPRVMPGGQVIIASTPWAESGLLYDLFSTNHGNPTTALAAHAPTLLLRDDPRTRSIVERERQRDPDNASREFDASFMSAGSGLFLDPASIDRAVFLDLTIPCMVSPDIRTAAGADLGFVSDSSALAIVAGRGERLALIALEELRPGKGSPLRPSDVLARFAALAKEHHCREIVSDGHYAETAREHLHGHGISLGRGPEGAAGKVASYLELRRLFAEGRIALPKHDRLLAQLREIRSKPTSGGGLQVYSPRRPGGGHGDLVSALVLAAWALSSSVATPIRLPTRLREMNNYRDLGHDRGF